MNSKSNAMGELCCNLACILCELAVQSNQRKKALKENSPIFELSYA